MKLLQITEWILCLVCCINCENILAIFHFPCKSHHILGSTLLKALARKGHQVTMVSPFPFTTSVANYTDVEITGMLEYKEKNILPKFVNAHELSMYDKMTFSIKNSKEVIELFFNTLNVKALLNSSRKYDVVILNWSMNEALLGIAHHFQAPVVVFSSIGPSQLTNKITRNPSPYSYIPNLFSIYPDDMTFFQRLDNAFWSFSFDIIDRFVNENVQKDILKKYFPSAPPLNDLIDNVSLVLLNSHYGIESSRPYVPNMVEIGGFHVEESKELKLQLKRFLDTAVDGFIFFSLGTNVKSSHLPEDKLIEIVKTFKNLRIKVLWKFEGKYFQDLPENVMVDEWLPQTDILAHPNIKAFVTHGGRLSTIEAMYYGVPIVGIPFFSDQEFNVADSVNKMYGIKVDFTLLNEKTLGIAIDTVINDKRYNENAKKYSGIFKDRPVKPLETAIYWIEYVMRHRGAPHLQTAAYKLSTLQLLLVDVIGAVLITMLVLLITSLFIISHVYRLIKTKLIKKFKVA